MSDSKTFNIRVVGDVTRDVLVNNGEPKSESPGGAYFVTRMLQDCGLVSNSQVGIQVLGYEDVEHLPNSRWEVNRYKKEAEVYRYSCNVPYPKQIINEENEAYSPELKEKEKEFQMLVVQNLWTQNGFLWNKDWEKPFFAEKFKPVKGTPLPSIILMLNKRIPQPKSRISQTNGSIDELLDTKFWEFFKFLEDNEYLQNTLSVVYADILRWHGFAISKQVSWERTAQDYLAEFFRNSVMKELSKIQHFVVRFGVTGVIHSYRLGIKSDRRLHRLFFDPKAEKLGIFRNTKVDGDMIGHQSILVASIVKELAKTIKVDAKMEALLAESSQFEISEIIAEGIRHSLCRSQMHFEKGIPTTDAQGFMSQGGFDQGIFHENTYDTTKIADERIPVGNPSWNILVQSSEYQLLPIAQKIARNGVDEVINNRDGKNEPYPTAPILRFGKDLNLIIVDRREIESYTSVFSILEMFVEETVKNFKHKDKCLSRPLSIALFGPPGSGKSFTAESLYESISPDYYQFIDNFEPLENPEPTKEVSKQINHQFITFNLSRTSDSSSLLKFFNTNVTSALEDVDSLIGKLYQGWKEKNMVEESDREPAFREYLNSTIPFIFFDEFDSDLDGKEVGWLKYFLSPMEDLKGKDYGCLTPVFFFAGGTSRNYLDFSREDSSISESKKAEFKLAKGTDFVSRLSGHINILGIDPVDEMDEAYIIRRGILLYSLIKKQFGSPNKVSKAIINTMIRISNYKHGARSMRALLSIFSKLGGDEGQVVFSGLPTIPQLNMHVDGQEFLAILQDEASSHSS